MKATPRLVFKDAIGAKLAWQDVDGNSDLDTSEWRGPNQEAGMRALTYRGSDRANFDESVAYLSTSGAFPGMKV